MKRSVILLGGGGHSRVLSDLLRLRKIKVLGVSDPQIAKGQKDASGHRSLGGDESIFAYSPKKVFLVNAVGSVKIPDLRQAVYERFKAKGFKFLTLVHPAAVIGRHVKIGEGSQVMAGAVVQAFSEIGENTIINTRAGVDHDCRIGSHVHIAPGVTICGGVTIGNRCHIGAGSTLVQGIVVPDHSFVRAGSLMTPYTQLAQHGEN